MRISAALHCGAEASTAATGMGSSDTTRLPGPIGPAESAGAVVADAYGVASAYARPGLASSGAAAEAHKWWGKLVGLSVPPHSRSSTLSLHLQHGAPRQLRANTRASESCHAVQDRLGRAQISGHQGVRPPAHVQAHDALSVPRPAGGNGVSCHARARGPSPHSSNCTPHRSSYIWFRPTKLSRTGDRMRSRHGHR